MHAHPPLHIAGPDDLVHAVLQMLGTTPKESLVLIGISDTEVTATVTVDLPAIALPGILPALFRSIKRSGATDAVALVYSTTAADTSMLAEPITITAAWAELELLAALRVRDGAVRPLAASTREDRRPAARRRTRTRR